MRAERVQIEIRWTLEAIRQDLRCADVVDRKDAHVGTRVIVADEIDATARNDESVGIDVALAARALLVDVLERYAPACDLGFTQRFENAFGFRLQDHLIDPQRERRTRLQMDRTARIRNLDQLGCSVVDRARERSAERGAEAPERDEAEQLAR